MAVQDVLSARLEVKDSFTSKLDNFIKATTKAEQNFEKFINNADKSARILEKTFDVLDAKLNSLNNKITAQSESVANKITNSANKIEQSQNKVINNLTNKYGKMGKDVQDVFKTINKDAESLAKSGLNIRIGNTTSNKNNEENDNGSNILGGIFAGQKTEGFLSGILSGNFTKILGTMSLIGAGIIGMKKVLDTIDGWAQQGFNALNTISTGLLSVNGIKEGLQDAGNFETSRVAMNNLYNSDTLGLKYYKEGIDLAKNTPYGEADIGALQKKLAAPKIDYSEKDLETLLNLASLKPEMGVEHVGFSLVR